MKKSLTPKTERSVSPRATMPARASALDTFTAMRSDLRVQRVLVPIDFSDQSQRSLGYAAALAKMFDSTVILLHVLPQQESAAAEPPGSSLVERFRQSCSRQLNELAREELHPSIHVQALVRTGHPVQQILAATEELGADLIVLSEHGASGREGSAMGSTAQQVVQKARCPVFIVRETDH